MITKGIIEEVLSPYEVRIRIPTLDRDKSSSLSTSTEHLNIATICTLPNCYVNLQVGDVVFVGFEDNTYYKAVVLGHLCREAEYTTYMDLNIGNLIVNSSAKLPSETSIGELSSIDLSQLKGVKDNLQKQIDMLQDKVSILEEQLFKS